MKIYNTKNGIIVERNDKFYAVNDESWDSFINDDNLYNKIIGITRTGNAISKSGNIIR